MPYNPQAQFDPSIITQGGRSLARSIESIGETIGKWSEKRKNDATEAATLRKLAGIYDPDNKDKYTVMSLDDLRAEGKAQALKEALKTEAEKRKHLAAQTSELESSTTARAGAEQRAGRFAEGMRPMFEPPTLPPGAGDLKMDLRGETPGNQFIPPGALQPPAPQAAPMLPPAQSRAQQMGPEQFQSAAIRAAFASGLIRDAGDLAPVLRGMGTGDDKTLSFGKEDVIDLGDLTGDPNMKSYRVTRQSRGALTPPYQIAGPDSGTAIPIVGKDGEQIGYGLPGRGGIKMIQTGEPTAKDLFRMEEKAATEDIDNAEKRLRDPLITMDPELKKEAQTMLREARESRAELLRRFSKSKNTPAAKPAGGGKTGQGGYVPGKRYGGLTYRGGDPNDRANWE